MLKWVPIGVKGYFIINFLETQCMMRTSWQANVTKWQAYIYLNTWCKQNFNACCHFPRHWATDTFLYSYKRYSERAKKTRFSIKLHRDTDLWCNANQIVYIMSVRFVGIKFKNMWSWGFIPLCAHSKCQALPLS